MSPVETVLEFMQRINQRDAAKLAARMTEDHEFPDALGHVVRGHDNMRAAWLGYYKMCPDYWVSHETVFANGQEVAVFGEAGGTIARDGKLPPENQWRIPAAWLAVVENDLVKQWRVYADNKPVYDIVAKRPRWSFNGVCRSFPGGTTQKLGRNELSRRLTRINADKPGISIGVYRCSSAA